MAKPLVPDELWELVEPMLPRHRRKPGRRGRPPVDDRAALGGILFVRLAAQRPRGVIVEAARARTLVKPGGQNVGEAVRAFGGARRAVAPLLRRRGWDGMRVGPRCATVSFRYECQIVGHTPLAVLVVPPLGLSDQVPRG
jgi:transposase